MFSDQQRPNGCSANFRHHRGFPRDPEKVSDLGRKSFQRLGARKRLRDPTRWRRQLHHRQQHDRHRGGRTSGTGLSYFYWLDLIKLDLTIFFKSTLYHYFLTLEESDTACGYCDYWITVQGCPNWPGNPHNLGPVNGQWVTFKSPFDHETKFVYLIIGNSFSSVPSWSRRTERRLLWTVQSQPFSFQFLIQSKWQNCKHQLLFRPQKCIIHVIPNLYWPLFYRNLVFRRWCCQTESAAKPETSDRLLPESESGSFRKWLLSRVYSGSSTLRRTESRTWNGSVPQSQLVVRNGWCHELSNN